MVNKEIEHYVNNYDIFAGDELKIADRILHLRILMLVHSHLYYEMNENVISDKQWDLYARELAKLQSDYCNISKQVNWYDDFKDWDASTGAFLKHIKSEWVHEKACRLLEKVK